MFFSKGYVVHLAERMEWIGGSHELLEQGIIWFTGSSKNQKGVGQENEEGEVSGRSYAVWNRS